MAPFDKGGSRDSYPDHRRRGDSIRDHSNRTAVCLPIPAHQRDKKQHSAMILGTALGWAFFPFLSVCLHLSHSPESFQSLVLPCFQVGNKPRKGLFLEITVFYIKLLDPGHFGDMQGVSPFSMRLVGGCLLGRLNSLQGCPQVSA